MKILVIGGGGREHALVWRLKQSPLVEKIWCAPGNGGIAAEAECVAIDAGDVAAAVALAEKIQPDLTVVGPELPLVNGLTDAFRKRNWAIVGPSKKAAQLEGSKIFSKEFLTRHKMPTAKMYGTYKSARCHCRAFESELAGGDQSGRVVRRQRGFSCAGRGGRQGFYRARDGKEGAGFGREPDPAGGNARGRRALVHYSHGREELRAAGADAGSQARVRWKRGAEYRRHGSVLDGRLVAGGAAQDRDSKYR